MIGYRWRSGKSSVPLGCRTNAEIGRRAGLPDDLTVVGRRAQTPGGVDLAAVRQVPRVGAELLPVLAVPHPADAGFAQIVHRGPDEVADHPRLAFDGAPVGKEILRQGFGGVHRQLGKLLMLLVEDVGVIVVADHAEYRGLLRALRRVGIDALSDRPRGIKHAHALGELAAGFDALRRAVFGDLVADAPEQHAGMVAAADDHAVDILLPIFGEEARIVLRLLALVPAVECFVDDQHAQFVRSVERGLAGRIVCVANGVVAGGLHQGDLAGVRVGRARSADHVVVVVDVAAAQQHRPAVDAQAFVGVQGDRADAEAGPPLIDGRPADADLLHQRVEIGGIRRPQTRIGHGQFLRPFGARTGRHRMRLPGLSDGFAVGRDHPDPPFRGLRFVRSVGDGGAHRDHASIFGRHRSGDEYAFGLDVDRIEELQGDRPDQPRARIPARRRVGMIDAHDDDVAAGADLAGQINGKGGVAVAVLLQVFAVHPDVGVHVHGFEVQPDDAGSLGRGENQLPAIPAVAAGQIARILAAEGSPDRRARLPSGLSMIEKSWGTATRCQEASSKALRSAPAASPAWKRQSCDRLRTSAQAGDAAIAISRAAAKRRFVAGIVVIVALSLEVVMPRLGVVEHAMRNSEALEPETPACLRTTPGCAGAAFRMHSWMKKRSRGKEAETAAADHAATLYGVMLQGVSMLRK